MRAGDTVAICDCLLYEFPTTIRRWTGVLAELARIAETSWMFGLPNRTSRRLCWYPFTAADSVAETRASVAAS